MTFRHLEAFVQVAEQGGFTRAADKLCLTQPTVSGQIKELEQQLGVSLFHRLPRVVELTEAGRLLLPRASELLASRDGLLEWAAAYRGLLWGRLMVHASTIPGEYFLPPLLAAFKGEHPELGISLSIHDSEAVLEQVRRGEASLGVVGKQVANGGLVFRPLWRDHIALYAGAGG
ncbi:MAG TPA: LysR family transcriptional regulator, partial [Deferrisomatales bacterium]|nr:LysR family transcriptional regulator [Deferrisomatales bacterium]